MRVVFTMSHPNISRSARVRPWGRNIADVALACIATWDLVNSCLVLGDADPLGS